MTRTVNHLTSVRFNHTIYWSRKYTFSIVEINHTYYLTIDHYLQSHELPNWNSKSMSSLQLNKKNCLIRTVNQFTGLY